MYLDVRARQRMYRVDDLDATGLVCMTKELVRTPFRDPVCYRRTTRTDAPRSISSRSIALAALAANSR